MVTFRVVTTFFLVFMFISNLYLALELYIPAVKEIIFYGLLIGTAIFLTIAEPKKALDNFSPYAFVWMLVITLVTIMGYLNSSMTKDTFELMVLTLKGIIIMICFFLIIATPEAVKTALYAILFALFVSTIVNTMDYFAPISLWEHIPGRAAGWYFDPNLSATMPIIGLIFATLIIPASFMWPLIIITSIGVLTTFSRGGWLELFIAIAGVAIIMGARKNKSFNILNFNATTFVAMLLGAAIAVGFVYVMFSGAGYDLVKDTWMEEYLSDDTMQRISGERDDGSSNERKHVLMKSIEVGMDNPVIGAGLGYTLFDWGERVGPHNTFTAMFADMGVIGLLAFLMLFVALWFGSGTKQAKLYVVVLAAYSIFSHANLATGCLSATMAIAFIVRDEHLDEPIPEEDVYA